MEQLRFIPEHHDHIYGYTKIYYGHTQFVTMGLPASQTMKV